MAKSENRDKDTDMERRRSSVPFILGKGSRMKLRLIGAQRRLGLCLLFLHPYHALKSGTPGLPEEPANPICNLFAPCVNSGPAWVCFLKAGEDLTETGMDIGEWVGWSPMTWTCWSPRSVLGRGAGMSFTVRVAAPQMFSILTEAMWLAGWQRRKYTWAAGLIKSQAGAVGGWKAASASWEGNPHKCNFPHVTGPADQEATG